MPGSDGENGAGLRGDIDNAGYFAFFDALLERRLTLGQTLKQEELGNILGQSLSPMRETTTLLEAEGLISVRRRVGITIFYPDVRFVRETFQLRGLLEREGLRRFARRMPPDWIDEMRKAHREIVAFVEKVHDEQTYRGPVRALEVRFHGSFIGAYDNEEISAIYARLQRKMYLLRLLNAESVSTASTVQAMGEHMAIIDALQHKNGDLAVEGLDRHMSGVIQRTLN